MRQHITVEQLNELTQKQKMSLAIWFKNHNERGDWWTVDTPEMSAGIVFVSGGLGGIAGMMAEEPYYPLLSIGQMIEFLDEKVPGRWSIDNTDSDGWYVGGGNMDIYPKGSSDSEELCDALWEAVKEVLE